MKFNDLVLEHQFVASDTFSIADIQIFFELSLYFFVFHVDIHSLYPKVAAWHDRVKEHP